jgi:hypothetical protein
MLSYPALTITFNSRLTRSVVGISVLLSLPSYVSGKTKIDCFCKDFTDRIRRSHSAPSSLRHSLFSHGNILNSLKLSFPRLN